MLNRALNIFFFSIALLTLLYFLNVWLQASIEIITNYGLSIIIISLIFAFIFISACRINNIYKLLFIAFIFYLSWGIVLQVTPTIDYKEFYRLSTLFYRTFDFEYVQMSKSTMTTIYYSAFFMIFGKSFITSYIAGACAWTIGCLFFYKSLINFNVNKDHAKLAIAITAFAPSTIAYATVVSSESVFFLLNFLALYFCSCYYSSKKVYMLGLASLMLGLAFITRTNGLVFFISFIFLVGYFFIKLKNEKKLYQVVLLSVTPFVAILFLQGLLNHSYTKKFSISASTHLAYNLLTGTHRHSKGGNHNRVAEIAGYKGANQVSHEEASKKAVQIATEHILHDPIDFLGFSLTKKIERFWGDDRYGIRWSLRKSPKYPDLASNGTIKLLQKVTNAYYILMITLFVFWFILRMRRDYIELGLFCLPLIGLALLHIIIEVAARYHIPFMPFIYFGAAGGVIILRQKRNDINVEKSL